MVVEVLLGVVAVGIWTQVVRSVKTSPAPVLTEPVPPLVLPPYELPPTSNHLPVQSLELWDGRAEPAFEIHTHAVGAPPTWTEAGRLYDHVEFDADRNVHVYEVRRA